MKSISNLEDYRTEFVHIFQSTDDVEILLENLKNLFLKILQPYDCMVLPKFQIISTGSLQFSVWYQDPDAITETLNIHQKKCDLYLWRCSDQKWYLDDLYDDINEIVEQIFKNIPAFHLIPENPKEVKALLENGLMDFKPEAFPKFSEKIPSDLNEVLTWDDRFLLVGTNIENLKIYSWKEWDDLIERENYLKNNGE
ncbi:hypothetical protein DJ533_08055 [Acinetobacter defluvii]|uniref:Uncharacterized protein n=1 Tax=Acinetobacter defluvii TaxID=1871111 RepID=A0A2S2FC43_9GAMM|nr:hypothetical protein [Acinetobacter defluvii]AWL28519.1 hypothetical protein DJ533_08055 [Acinetobacter defluvii]